MIWPCPGSKEIAFSRSMPISVVCTGLLLLLDSLRRLGRINCLNTMPLRSSPGYQGTSFSRVEGFWFAGMFFSEGSPIGDYIRVLLEICHKMVCGLGDSKFRAPGKAYASLCGLKFQAGLVDSLYMFRVNSKAATIVSFSNNFL